MDRLSIWQPLLSGLLFGSICAAMALARNETPLRAFVIGLFFGPFGLCFSIYLNIRSQIAAARYSGFAALAALAVVGLVIVGFM